MPECIYKSIVDFLQEGLYFVDTDRTITYWNKGAERISGFSAEEVIGKKCSDNILTHVDEHGNSLCLGSCPLLASIEDQQSREAVVYLHHKNGQRIPVQVWVNPLFDSTDKLIGGFEVFTDISNKQANEAKIIELERLSLLDHLTQLSNRAYVEKELEAFFAEKERFGMPFGIIFIDIDFFKKINDTYGHDIGDEVLKFVAKTFSSNSRPFDLYGRWGGDEFIGILKNIDQKALCYYGERLRQLIENSYIMTGTSKIQVTISLGGTLARNDDTPSSILKRADELLYRSKKTGRNHLTSD